MKKTEKCYRIRREGTTSGTFPHSGHDDLKSAMKELTEVAKNLNNGTLTYFVEMGSNGETLATIATLTKKDGIQLDDSICNL